MIGGNCEGYCSRDALIQVLEGGFDASAAATRGAVGVILSTISIRLGYRKGALLYPTVSSSSTTVLLCRIKLSTTDFIVSSQVVRDQLFPALARSLNKYGAADDDELGKVYGRPQISFY